MATIYPITSVGSTSSLLYYAEQDFIGVEKPADSTTDHRGFNEIASFTQRVDTGLQSEHYANGVHNVLSVARAICHVDWTQGDGYSINDKSYSQSTAGAVLSGTAAMSVARIAGGQVTITLAAASALPSVSYRVADMTSGVLATASVRKVNVWLASITSTTVFALNRWEGADSSTLALTDGPILVMVHGG